VGPAGHNFAIADAGPLIHLSEIGSLVSLLVFDALHIPDAVWVETVGSGRVAEAALLDLGIVHQHNLLPGQVSAFVDQNGLQALQAGEVECLTLCRHIGIPLLLTDDLAVRDAAQRLGIRPVGSLGVVVRAYRLGQLSLTDAEQLIESLYTISTLFVTRAIVDLAIAQLRTT
jgi:predicted nucleic acid-binding protein